MQLTLDPMQGDLDGRAITGLIKRLVLHPEKQECEVIIENGGREQRVVLRERQQAQLMSEEQQGDFIGGDLEGFREVYLVGYQA